MARTILLVEDNAKVMKLNSEALTMRGYRVLEAETLAKGRELFLSEKPDLIVLDIMLPDGNGLELCEQLREGIDRVPILFLSGLKEEDDMTAGFEAGGDDYLPKPYTLKMLFLRIENLFRREATLPQTITIGNLVLRVDSNRAFINGVDIGLSKDIEFSLMCIFAQNENKLFTSEQLYERAWGQPMGDDTRALRAAIKRMRPKLSGSGYTITTEHGKGYIFEKGEIQ